MNTCFRVSVCAALLLLAAITRVDAQCVGCTSYAPAPWPGTPNSVNAGLPWVNYRTSAGQLIQDVSDQNPANNDIHYSTADPSSVALAFDGTNAFFRLQLLVDPSNTNPSAGGFDNNASYLVQIADAAGTHLFTVGMDAKSSNDYVYVTTPTGSVTRTAYTWSGQGTSAMRSRIVPGSTTYYLEYQIPFCEITCVTAGAVTSYTPLRLYYGTSSSNQTINKDFAACTGNGCAVDFSIMQQTTFNNVLGGSLLPVELTSFSAVPRNGVVELSWRTETEADNAGFMVERATGASSLFVPLTFVPGAGSSSTPKRYAYTDAGAPRAATLRYRLRQIDRDGSTSLSPVVEIAPAAAPRTQLLDAYPNPAAPSALVRIPFTLAAQSQVRLRVVDADGTDVTPAFEADVEAGAHARLLDAAPLAPGFYLVILEVPGAPALTTSFIRL